ARESERERRADGTVQMDVDAFEHVVRAAQDSALAPARAVERRRRVGNEIRGVLDDDRLDVFVDRKRKMEQAREALDVPLAQRREVLGHQTKAFGHWRGEADRK